METGRGRGRREKKGCHYIVAARIYLPATASKETIIIIAAITTSYVAALGRTKCVARESTLKAVRDRTGHCHECDGEDGDDGDVELHCVWLRKMWEFRRRRCRCEGVRERNRSLNLNVLNIIDE